MNEIIKGSESGDSGDVIIKGIVSLDDVQQDIDSVLSRLRVIAYDSQGTKIDQWAWPLESGYTEIKLDGNSDALIYLAGSKTYGKASGSILWVENMRKSNTNYPDVYYDLAKEQQFGYLK